MNLIVLDTETTDLDPDKGARMIEIAWIELTNTTGNEWETTFSVEARIQYDGPINPQAQAVHHIRADQLTEEAGAVKRYEIVQLLLGRIRPDTLFVAHNAMFDSKFLPEVNQPWLCTMRAAKHIWPNAPAYGNQVLRYWLKLEPELPVGRFPHQAIYDVATTTCLLQRMLKQHTPQQLLHMTSAPIRMRSINFGKHRGLPFEEIPRDYLQWLRKQEGLHPDLQYTIDAVLK
jgi:exodeoxyribonuclease X